MGIYACEDVCVNINNTKSQKHTKQRKDKIMIRRNLLKATLLTTVIATLLVSSACGSKNKASTNNDTAQSVQATTAKTVIKETEKNSDNNNTETSSDTVENESLDTDKISEENEEVIVSDNNNNENPITEEISDNGNYSSEQEIIVVDNGSDNNSNYVENNDNVVPDNNTQAPAPEPTPVIDNTPASAEIEKPVKQPVSTTPYEYDPMDGSTYTGYNLWRTWRRQFIGLGGEMITSDEAFAHIKNICERYASGSLTKEQAEKELWTCESDLSDINGVTAKSFITDGKYPTITNYDDYAKLNWDINDGVEAVDAGMTCYTILYYNPAEDKTIFYYVGINLTNYK